MAQGLTQKAASTALGALSAEGIVALRHKHESLASFAAQRAIRSGENPLQGLESPELPSAAAQSAASSECQQTRKAPPGASARLLSSLLDDRVLAASALLKVLARHPARRASLATLARSHTLAEDADLADALAARLGLSRLSEKDGPPDPGLIDAFGLDRCVRLRVVPWCRRGGVTLVATSDPESVSDALSTLRALFGPLALGVISEREFYDALAAFKGRALVAQAEASVPAAESCRGWRPRRVALALTIGLAGAGLWAFVAPQSFILAGLAVLLVFLLLTSLLKLAAAVAATRAPAPSSLRLSPSETPFFSLLIPLYREPTIAPRLIRRLEALDWPREQLEVLLVVEADDHATANALKHTALPGFMRVIVVPEGQLKTKPRALNYALNFTRGDIIGVYDAEDAPEPDQLRQVAAAFATGGARVGCVQGVLDYYNALSNWLTRCFTIEYAAWFRLILPGLARLGLVVPLGGTTLFLRRETLSALGGWDAHNVTEDADLGVRLARHGWKTVLVSAATLEEANGRPWAWIRQRSRWLKGYAMTWAVHARHPVRLWRDLGPWRFFGFQILFLGTLVQFLFAPLFWALWLLTFGIAGLTLPAGAVQPVVALLLFGEAVTLGVNLLALRTKRHRPLRLWVIALWCYFPLATLAAWKAVWELLARPFFWDKTTHGVDDRHHIPVVRGT